MKKAAVIGYGGMGSWHVNHIQNSDVVSLAGIYDILPEKRALAESRGIRAYASREELLADKEIELVTIAIPNDVHEEVGIACMNAGKNVIMEKPVTLSLESLERLIECSKKNGVKFTVHQNRRWDKDYRVMRDVVEGGTIGKVYSIESRVYGTVGAMYGWRAFKDYGGGMVYDWGVHMFDQLLWMYGDKKIVDVKAELMSLLEANREVDDYFKVMMKVEGGPVLTVEVGSYAFRALPRWYCIGDNGTLQIDDFTAEKGGITRPRFGAEGNVAPVVVQTPAGPTRMMAPRPPETREELELPKSDADWTSLYKNLLDVIDNGAELIVKPEQVRRVLQLIETIFESAKTGHSVACRI